MMSTTPENTYFAACSPGVEPLLEKEMRILGYLTGPAIQGPVPEEGGFEFTAGPEGLYSANLWLRTAGRILMRLGDFYASGFPELIRKASRLPWDKHLVSGRPVALRVTCKKSKLYHSDAVAERVMEAISDKMGKTVSLKKFDEEAEGRQPQLVIVRFNLDHCTISIDSSGQLLHRRGYRQAVAKAPLRETLAAAMLLGSGWDCKHPLIDPFCGSGTIPIEAALMARRMAPGRNRKFGFMDWPDFDKALWESVVRKADAGVLKECPVIIGTDRDAGAVEAARENAKRAGVDGNIRFEKKAVSSILPGTTKGWLLTNPPYGVRLGSSGDLRDLYSRFGMIVRTRFRGWKVGVLSGNDNLMGHAGIRFEKRWPMLNGGIKVKLATGSV
jgi:putative N6-adenine-specific DNA methylase